MHRQVRVDGFRRMRRQASGVTLRRGSHVRLRRSFHRWYLARNTTYTVVLKVSGGVVEELGIADNELTTSRGLQSVRMHSFY